MAGSQDILDRNKHENIPILDNSTYISASTASLGSVIGTISSGSSSILVGGAGSAGSAININSSGSIWASYDNYAYVTKTDIGDLLSKMGIEKGSTIDTCTSCNREKEIAIQYEGLALTRKICKDCCTPVIDRIFGLNINPKAEQILYGTNK